jgi:hypothetical protein
VVFAVSVVVAWFQADVAKFLWLLLLLRLFDVFVPGLRTARSSDR